MSTFEEPPAKRPRILGLDGADDMVRDELTAPTHPLPDPVREATDEQAQTELNIGITEIVSTELSGFEGILKQRFAQEMNLRSEPC